MKLFLTLETVAISAEQWPIAAICVPARSSPDRILANKPPDTRIIHPVAEQLQPAVGVALVLRRPDEPERRRRAACATDRHSESIVEDRIGDRLAAVRDTTRAAKRIAVVELAGS